MKLTVNTKTLLVLVSVIAGTVAYTKSAVQSQPCPTTAAIDENCTVDQQSWLSWLKGDSRSTQFHFIDLLELLNRLTPKPSSNSGT